MCIRDSFKAASVSLPGEGEKETFKKKIRPFRGSVSAGMVMNESLYGNLLFFPIFNHPGLSLIEEQNRSQVRVIKGAAHRRVGNLVAQGSPCLKAFFYAASPAGRLVKIKTAPVLKDISPYGSHISYLREMCIRDRYGPGRQYYKGICHG